MLYQYMYIFEIVNMLMSKTMGCMHTLFNIVAKFFITVRGQKISIVFLEHNCQVMI